MRRLFAVAVAAAMVLPVVTLACSMCQCSDPTYRMVGDGFFSAQPWRFSLELDRNAKDQVAEADPAMREAEHEERITLAATWMPRPWLRFVGRVPATHRVIAMGPESSALTGLSDPELYVHLRIAGDDRRWAAVMGGVRTPWGQNDRSLGGARAEEHLQPGAGATAGMAGLGASIDLGGGRHLYASMMGRTCGENAHAYRYGDALVGTLSAQRDLTSGLAGVLELNARGARPDRVGGAEAENTGGSVLYVTPRLQAGLGEHTVLRLGAQLPVWQNPMGDQNEHANFLGGVSFVF